MRKELLKDLIIKLESGSRPKGGATSSGIPSLGGENINVVNKLNFNKKKLISIEHYNKMKQGLIEVEDILIVKDGATTGRVAFVGNEFPYEKAAINEHLFRIKVDKKRILPNYLYFYLVSPMGKSQVMKDFRGATIGGITKNFVEFVNVPLPSIEDQKHIINVIEEVVSIIEKRQSQITALEELTKSVFLEMFGDPVSNSKKWPQVTLNDFGEWKSGGTPSKSNKDYYMGNIPWLSSGELNEIYTYDSEEHITEKAVEESATKYIDEGSILLGMYDTAALKSTIVKMRCTCNQAIAFSKLDENRVSTLYVYQYIQMAKEHLKRQQRGVRQKNMNLSMIKELIVMYPPLDLQKEFEKWLKMILDKKELLKCGLVELEGLYNALLQKAFKGELF